MSEVVSTPPTFYISKRFSSQKNFSQLFFWVWPQAMWLSTVSLKSNKNLKYKIKKLKTLKQHLKTKTNKQIKT